MGYAAWFAVDKKRVILTAVLELQIVPGTKNAVRSHINAFTRLS
jgi:hypothetical protein